MLAGCPMLRPYRNGGVVQGHAGNFQAIKGGSSRHLQGGGNTQALGAMIGN